MKGSTTRLTSKQRTSGATDFKYFRGVIGKLVPQFTWRHHTEPFSPLVII